MTRIVRT